MTLVYHSKPILVADYVALLNEMDGSGYNLQEQFRDGSGDYLIFAKKRMVNTYEPKPVCR